MAAVDPFRPGTSYYTAAGLASGARVAAPGLLSPGLHGSSRASIPTVLLQLLGVALEFGEIVDRVDSVEFRRESGS